MDTVAGQVMPPQREQQPVPTGPGDVSSVLTARNAATRGQDLGGWCDRSLGGGVAFDRLGGASLLAADC
jgi:hypothetical protein